MSFIHEFLIASDTESKSYNKMLMFQLQASVIPLFLAIKLNYKNSGKWKELEISEDVKQFNKCNATPLCCKFYEVR